mgnify:CR=1 FL=1|jgi:hypothetical protein
MNEYILKYQKTGPLLTLPLTAIAMQTFPYFKGHPHVPLSNVFIRLDRNSGPTGVWPCGGCHRIQPHGFHLLSVAVSVYQYGWVDF